MNPNLDDLVDREVSEALDGQAERGADTGENSTASYRVMAAEISRAFAEESPRLSAGAAARQLARLRSQTVVKHARPRFELGWILHTAPRWAQIAAVAIIAVIVANGISVASASSLPGSPLYSVKRLTEQSNVLMSPTAGERARVWMGLASRRLDEVQSLLAVQPRVDSSALDDIDESILHALTETASTGGTERIVLLQEIIQLSLREERVLNGLAENAQDDDRARFERTARLLGDVAHIANSTQSSLVTPTSTATATMTSTTTATPTAKPSFTLTRTPSPIPPATDEEASPIPATEAPTVEDGQQQHAPAVATPTPDGAKSEDGKTQGGQSQQTPKPGEKEPTDGQPTVKPAPTKNATPAREPTESEAGRRWTRDR